MEEPYQLAEHEGRNGIGLQDWRGESLEIQREWEEAAGADASGQEDLSGLLGTSDNGTFTSTLCLLPHLMKSLFH